MIYSWLSDKELELRVEELHARAHDAKFQNYVARSRDWEVAYDELLRRRNANPTR